MTRLLYRLWLRAAGIPCRTCGERVLDPYAHQDLEHAGDEL